MRPQIAAELPFDEFNCTDYRWFPGGTQNSPPDHAVIDHWSYRKNVENQETGISELRIVGGAQKLPLVKSSPGKAQLRLPKFYTSRFGLVTDSMVGIDLSLRQADGSFCEISFSTEAPNLAMALMQKIGEYNRDNIRFEGGFHPYLLGQDELSYSVLNYQLYYPEDEFE